VDVSEAPDLMTGPVKWLHRRQRLVARDKGELAFRGMLIRSPSQPPDRVGRRRFTLICTIDPGTTPRHGNADDLARIKDPAGEQVSDGDGDRGADFRLVRDIPRLCLSVNHLPCQIDGNEAHRGGTDIDAYADRSILHHLQSDRRLASATARPAGFPNEAVLDQKARDVRDRRHGKPGNRCKLAPGLLTGRSKNLQ